MNIYRKILLAVELESSCDDLPVKKAQEIAKQFSSDLYIIHALEHLSSFGAAYGVAAGADIEEMLLENAQASMKKLTKKLNISEDKQLIKVGPAKSIIVEEAQKHKIDLIIMGSHGRHGIRLLLGSTANAVLHSAKCDVLAVRIAE